MKPCTCGNCGTIINGFEEGDILLCGKCASEAAQENMLTDALNCLYYGECTPMLTLAKKMNKEGVNHLKSECIRLDRFVSSISTL